MYRTWTETSKAEWTRRRDEYRERKGFEPIAELRASGDPQKKNKYKGAVASERETLVERLETNCTKTAAWLVEKHPVETYPSPMSGTLYLPLQYQSLHGEKKIRITQGEDLNKIVFNFYNDAVDSTYPGANFVRR